MLALTRRGLLNLTVAGLGFVYGSGTVKLTTGESMSPTLNNLELIFIDVFSQVKAGDVVTLVTPEEDALVCKRIIGMGGDVLLSRSKGEIIVPDGKCWVEGDNSNSLDSNSFGPVPLQNILGCVKYSLGSSLRKIENRRSAFLLRESVQVSKEA